MKKLFANYNFEFDKNERKLLTAFCRQTLKQIEGNNDYFAEIKAFSSITGKLSGSEEVIKLTKDEKMKLTRMLEQNTKHLEKEMDKSWFFKKWLYKSLHKQYSSLLQNHFKN